MNKYDRMSKDHLIQQIRALEHQLLLLQRETCIYWNLNREEFNYLTEDHREVICRLAPDGTILFINPAGCRFFRQSWPDLIGNNLGNISEPDFNRKLQSLFNMLSPTQPVMDWEYGPTFLNHTFLNWNWRIRGLFSADQTLREIQLVGTDLTEQKFFKQVLDKTKQTLHKEILHYEQAQQDFYELFDLASEIIYTHDFEGRLLYINKNGESILGFETGTLKGRSIFELVVPDKHNLLEERISSRFNNQQKINYELPVVKADGETAILELTSRIIFREDQPHAIMGIGRDITQRKQIESALREGEAKFRKLAETSPSFIVVVQGQHYKYVNPTFERLTGYSQEELLAIHFWDIIHPDYRDLVKGRGLARQQGAELISRYEFKINGKNGQELWIDLSADCIEFEGRPAIIATGIEISSRKELEHALINSEENFRKLANTAPALIFVVQNYRFQYVNAFFTNVTGYNAYDILELNAMDILHWDYHELLDNELTQLLLGKIPSFRHDIIIFSKTGREYWMDLSANRIEYGGKPAVIATAYDITARKELESALTNSEENFRRLAETAPALIYVVQNRELVFFNLETLRVTGYSRDELINMKNWEFIHPDHRDWIDSITTARHRGEDAPRRYETVILNKEGQSLWIEVAVSIIQFNNQPASLGVGIDITERKRALEQITYLSYHDRLTGLYNRAFLEEKLRELDDNQHLPLSMIIGDVNGLKMINDALGHHKGDLLLKMVADALKSCCRNTDIVARWGGDEFVVLLPHTDEKTASRICEKITGIFNQHEEFPLQVSISLGVSTKTKSSQVLTDINREAEDRMYRSKLLAGKSNRSIFIRSLEKTLWTRSHETQNHTERLRRLVLEIGHALSLETSDLDNLALLAALHDIGKIAIPNAILDKKERLTEDEWETIKKHPEIGYRIAMSSPELTAIAECILTHHERWDGNGYPLGLEAEAIPLLARILSIADAYDVMLNGRPYQARISIDEALAEIDRCAGTQFDPDLARLFIQLIRKERIQFQIEVI